MISRMCAGGLVVFFCVSVVLAPGETFGRGGGAAAEGDSRDGRFRSVRASIRRRSGRRRSCIRTSPASAARCASPASAARCASPASAARCASPASAARCFGYGFVPLTGFGGGLDYGAPDYVKPYDQPAEAEPETRGAILTPGSAPSGFRPVMVYRPGCQTQTVTVPWERRRRPLNQHRAVLTTTLLAQIGGAIYNPIGRNCP